MPTRRMLPLLFGLTTLSVASLASAAETPQQRYHLDLTCASVTAAVSAETQSQAAPADRQKAAELTALTLAAARTSGGALGLTPTQVEHAVTENRDSLLVGLRQPDRAKAEEARKDLGQTVIRCALLHAMSH